MSDKAREEAEAVLAYLCGGDVENIEDYLPEESAERFRAEMPEIVEMLLRQEASARAGRDGENEQTR